MQKNAHLLTGYRYADKTKVHGAYQAIFVNDAGQKQQWSRDSVDKAWSAMTQAILHPENSNLIPDETLLRQLQEAFLSLPPSQAEMRETRQFISLES